MSTSPALPAVYTREYRDTSITVWWPPESVEKWPTEGPNALALEIREFPKPQWASVPLPPATRAAGVHVVAGLYPNSTWEFRFRAGEVAGPAAAADTLAAGCVPKDTGETGAAGGRKKGCAVA